MKKLILIFGSTGLLGSQLSSYFNENYRVVTAGFKQKNCDLNLDITNKKETFNAITKVKPNIIINCVAYTEVDKSNINLNIAFDKNVISVFNIVDALRRIKKKIHLIHISTDQVYNNKSTLKKNEENEINLINNYGLTKYMGEKQIVNYNLATTLRTNFFGNSLKNSRNSYSDWIKINLIKKKFLKIPNNIYFNPIHMSYLSKIIDEIIKYKVFGTFNVGSKNGISKYKFVKLVAKQLKLNLNQVRKFKSDVNIHRKPLGTIMSTKKIEKKLRFKLPRIEESISLLY